MLQHRQPTFSLKSTSRSKEERSTLASLGVRSWIAALVPLLFWKEDAVRIWQDSIWNSAICLTYSRLAMTTPAATAAMRS